jgi:hypothetical protein
MGRKVRLRAGPVPPKDMIDRRRVGSTGLAITIPPGQAEQGAASSNVPQPGAAPFLRMLS